MKTEWRGQTFDVRDIKIYPGYIREGDWIWSGPIDGYVRVQAIQRDCPRLENLSSHFTMFTCEKRDGTILPMRDLSGLVPVLKRNRKLVRV